jgi:DNA-binding protein H-NS
MSRPLRALMPLLFSNVRWRTNAAQAKEGKPVAQLNLKIMSVNELIALRDKVQAELSRKIGAERSALEKQIEALSKLERGGRIHLNGAKRRARTALGDKNGKANGSSGGKAKVAPKYRGPKGETWTGRGRAPRWLTALEADGKKRDSYRIKA